MTPLTSAIIDRLHDLFRGGGGSFPSPEYGRAGELLEEWCGRSVPGLIPPSDEQVERLRVAALKVSGGDLSQLQSAVWLAWSDWRELLVQAGFAEDPTAHLRWRPIHRLQFTDPLNGLINTCETRCVTACCGLEAYEVSALGLTYWGRLHGLPDLLTALGQLETELKAIAQHLGPVAGHDTLLYHTWNSEAECLTYFEMWRQEIGKAVIEVGGPAVVHPSWLTPTVRGLVAGIVADGGFDRLPVLADALEEAGCDSRLVLDHLRGPGDHGPFCWVTDLYAAAG